MLPDLVAHYAMSMIRMRLHQAIIRIASVLMIETLCVSWVLGFSPARAASESEIAELRRAVEALQAENLSLAKRVQTLEAERAQPGAADPRPLNAQTEDLAQRVRELEMGRIAQEDAVRTIIKSSVSTLGSKINESVAFGGALEMIAGRSKNFSGKSAGTVGLNTAEFDFEIQVNDWVMGSLVVEYVDGDSVVFSTTAGYDTGVDRFNIDTATITIGDTQRFPLYFRTGRMILPFGSSTGVHRADVLSIESPTTIDVFEMRKNAVGFGFAFPTPTPKPPTPPVIVPPVRPQVLNPLVGAIGGALGYVPPPPRPQQPNLMSDAPDPPPFTAALYFYDGNALKDAGERSRPGRHIAATIGYRAKGHCGRAYEALWDSWFCPWTLGVDLDYNRSVFDSRFLEAEYRSFLGRIGAIPGMAASVKSTFGPFSLVAEWNGAMKQAKFTDDAGKAINIKPTAWQLSLGYQFDWNPWVETIGAQGTFIAVGYSESRDLAGVTRIVNNESSRIGFAPKKRLLLTAGEWVLDGVKLAVEYSRNWDYPTSAGGTGNTAKGLFTTLTYTW